MDDKTLSLIDNVKAYNEKLAYDLKFEFEVLEKQVRELQQIKTRKETEFEELKKEPNILYVIWDKEANQWLSAKHFCINQYGQVVYEKNANVVAGQDDFQIRFITETDVQSSNEIIELAAIGEVIKKKMEESDFLAFGKINNKNLFRKIVWTKYKSIKEFMYRHYGRDTLERKINNEINKLDADIEEWHKEKNKNMRNSKINILRLREKFIIYCYDFQKFDMYKKREIEEIQRIINAIPHNRGFIRNDIIFEGTFDYLVDNIEFIGEKVSLLLNDSNIKMSIGEFIQFALPQK